MDNAGATPLHKAAHRGWDHTVKLLVDLGADVNMAMDKDNRTALHLASFQGHTETVRVLVQTCGANVAAKTTAEATALHYAAMGGHSEVVAVLLDECDADVMCRMKGGRTALHLAAAKQFFPVVRVLMAFLLNPKDVSVERRRARARMVLRRMALSSSRDRPRTLLGPKHRIFSHSRISRARGHLSPQDEGRTPAQMAKQPLEQLIQAIFV